MKLKYQTLSKEEKNKEKEAFLKTKECEVYKKAHKIFTLAIIGVIIAIISISFDLVYKTGIASYIMDILLFLFSLIFIVVMNNIKIKEINKFVINKKKTK